MMKPAKSKSHLRRVEKAAQKVSEVNWLEILSEVSRIANSSLELEDRLNSIVEIVVRQTGADACSILLMDEDGENLILRATKGLNPMSINRVRLKIGEGISGWVCQNKKVAALRDAASDSRFVHFPVTEEERFRSVLVVPIMEKEDCIGVIYTQSITEKDYSEDDIKLLTTIADQVSGIIKNAQLYEKATQRLRELSMLYEMSMAMQTTINLDRLLRIILSCVTAGGAFGFNRAGLFLVNEKTNTLHGMMGLGPDSGEEAREIWSKIPQITDLSQWLISQGELLAKKESGYDRFIKGIRLPIDRDSGVIALTALEVKPFNIKDGWNDPRVNRDIVQNSGVNSFAAVPIIAKENVLGVIVVDNIYTGKPITDEDLQTLVRFAVHAGWAIENSKLFAKLKEANKEIVSVQQQVVQSERLSALGELAAELAHEIKNPLVTIGGFARRLSEKYEPTSEEKSYAGIIISEVERLEKLLKDILNYSRDIKPNFSENNINSVIEEILSFYEHTFWESGIEIKKEMSDAIHSLSIDPPQIKQVLTNIFHNAVESMTVKGGVMAIKTEPLSGEEGVTISVSDTGGGIPSEILENIFNPFFTTKKYGTGLGLSLSRKIVESHGGTIEINNRVGEGATFIINLPRRQIK
ncbi:MAG: GAF domain-containing protein [Nitrospinae bacterium]|nr:GAF domain-containing protein [Nitrospinota bacterium]MBI3814401.1 GAF domain-containing protein [Nitrospinota bacterium]